MLEKQVFSSKQDQIDVFNSMVIACCNARDYMNGYKLLTVCFFYFILLVVCFREGNSVFSVNSGHHKHLHDAV